MAQNKDFKIKNGLQVGGATSLSDSLSVTGNLTISGSGTITIGGDTFSKVLDSDLTTSLIDSAYVQQRQDKAYSSLTGAPSIPVFGVDFVDSSSVIDIINSQGLDSDLVKALVDSAYIQLRDRFQDSSLVTSTVDATYVQARENNPKLGTDFIDSSEALKLIDANALDSARAIDLIDSAYIQLRQAAGGGTDFIFKTIAVAGQSNVVADTTTDTLTLAAGGDVVLTTDAASDTVTITTNVPKFGTDFVDSAATNALIDARVTNTFINNLSGVDADTLGGQSGSYYLAYANITGKPTIPSFGNDFIDSTVGLTLIDANALDSGRATTLIDSSYIQHRTRIGLNDIDFGSNKILYSNIYDSPGLFPSASTYHGMFAHAHNTGAGYYAHGGVWIRLANYDQIPTVPSFGNDFIDSSVALTLIDANALDSARALNLIPKFGTDFIDSAAALTLIDANALDSARALNLIPKFGTDFIDSAAALTLIDANALDSARASTLIDSAYIRFRQLSPAIVNTLGTVSLGSDVTAVEVRSLIGAASSAAAGGLDSARILTFVDSSYVVNRIPQVGAQLPFRTRQFQYHSTPGQKVYSGQDMLASLALSYQALRFNVFFNGLLLADSDFSTDSDGSGNQTIVLTDSADSGDIVTIVTYEAASGIDSAEALKLIDANALDSARAQSLITVPKLGSECIDSAEALKLIDANALDSARALNLIPRFGIDFVDSSSVIDIINSQGLDSDLVKALVDSAYIQLRDRFQDSSLVTSTVDAAYVQARQVKYTNADFLDSTTITGVVDASYVQARQTTYSIPAFGTDFIDSAAALTLIDANALDSNRGLARTGGTMSGDINMDSNSIVKVHHLGIGTVSPLSPLHINDSTGTYGQIRLSNGATSNVWQRVDSAEFRVDWFSSVNRKVNILNSGNGNINVGIGTASPAKTLDVSGTLNVTGATTLGSTLNGHTIPGGTGTLALTSNLPTLGGSFVDSAQTIVLIDANALDSGRAISLIDSAYIQQRRPAESRFVVVNNGSSAYRFTGDGFSSSSDNPTLYLQRGKTYSFVVSASGHPFQIRTSSGGSAYNTGVTNNGVQTGTLTFTPDMNAPDTLYYQCTAHSGMIGTIKIFDFNTFVDSGRVSSIITADVDAAFVAALGTSAIPNLPTSKITSGTFDSARIPVLSASDIVTGTIDSARIPVLSASNIGTGTIDSDRLPTGVFGGGGGGGSGISGITVQEEGSSLSTLATSLNFVVTAVTATGSGATKTITISGGGSGTLDSSLTTALIDSSYVQARQAAGAGFTVQDEASALSTLATTLNFTGAGVTASGTGATKTVNIPGGSSTGSFQSDRITITEFTADSGQTTFSGLDYTVGKTQVFLNGIQLVNTSDYTATNGSSIVLGSGADSGNTVTVISHKLQDQLFTAATNITNYFYTNTLVADSSVTSFGGADDAGNTLAYTPGKLQVYLNGIFLKDSDDYTASNGSNVVLTQAADSDDVISIVTYITENTTGGATRIDNFYYTADSGQTAFTGTDDDGNTLSYTADRLQVYLNGILLRDSADYTATNGSTITLIEGTDSADILTVSAFTTKPTGKFDSASIQGFIDSAYVAARVTIPRFGADFIDSGAALTLIDANALDSGRATTLITTLIDANALDSGRATSLIDSAYVQLRQSGGAITVQEEGSALSTSATTLNFVGTNVTATGSGATKTITITGGGGGGLDSAGVTTIVNTKLATIDVTDLVGADGQANQLLKSLGDGNVEFTNLKIPQFTPNSATSVGERGEFTFDSSYMYICTATNTWRRIAHSTW